MAQSCRAESAELAGRWAMYFGIQDLRFKEIKIENERITICDLILLQVIFQHSQSHGGKSFTIFIADRSGSRMAKGSMSPFWTMVIEMVIVGVVFLLFYAVSRSVSCICRKKSMCIYSEQAGS